MSDGSTLVLFVGASLALLAVPGPAVIYVVLAGALGGRLRAGRARLAMGRLSGGVLIGLGVIAALSGTNGARTAG